MSRRERRLTEDTGVFNTAVRDVSKHGQAAHRLARAVMATEGNTLLIIDPDIERAVASGKRLLEEENFAVFYYASTLDEARKVLNTRTVQCVALEDSIAKEAIDGLGELISDRLMILDPSHSTPYANGK